MSIVTLSQSSSSTGPSITFSNVDVAGLSSSDLADMIQGMLVRENEHVMTLSLSDFDKGLRNAVVRALYQIIDTKMVNMPPTSMEDVVELAAHILDRYMISTGHSNKIQKMRGDGDELKYKNYVQLMGFVAFQIAIHNSVAYAGYDGSCNVQQMIDLLLQVNFLNPATRSDFLQMKDLMLRSLGYKIQVPTPSTFAHMFLQQMFLYHPEISALDDQQKNYLRMETVSKVRSAICDGLNSTQKSSWIAQRAIKVSLSQLFGGNYIDGESLDRAILAKARIVSPPSTVPSTATLPVSNGGTAFVTPPGTPFSLTGSH